MEFLWYLDRLQIVAHTLTCTEEQTCTQMLKTLWNVNFVYKKLENKNFTSLDVLLLGSGN